MMSQHVTVMGVSAPRAVVAAEREAGVAVAVRAVAATEAKLAPVVLRVALAAVIFPHGAQKALGWFGGPGFEGTLGFFASMGIPAALGVLAIAAESLGALALAAGLLTRVAAAGIAAVMVVAALTVHLQHGFFMNWYGAQGGEGFEYHLLALGMAAALVVQGAGAWSLDRLLARRG